MTLSLSLKGPRSEWRNRTKVTGLTSHSHTKLRPQYVTELVIYVLLYDLFQIRESAGVCFHISRSKTLFHVSVVQLGPIYLFLRSSSCIHLLCPLWIRFWGERSLILWLFASQSCDVSQYCLLIKWQMSSRCLLEQYPPTVWDFLSCLSHNGFNSFQTSELKLWCSYLRWGWW